MAYKPELIVSLHMKGAGTMVKPISIPVQADAVQCG